MSLHMQALEEFWGRRRFLRSLGRGLIVSGLTSCGTWSLLSSFRAAAQEPLGQMELPQSLSGRRLYQDVVKWSEFPDHRTGYPGDFETGEWIADRFKSSGLEAEFQNYTLPQFFLREASLTVNRQAVECFPFWIPPSTGEAPVSGLMVLFSPPIQNAESYAGKVVLFSENEVRKLDFAANAQKLLGAGAVGLILISSNSAGEIVALNSGPPYNRQPLPRPVVLAGEKDFERLRQAAMAGQTASIRITGEYRPQAPARNTIGRLDRKSNRWFVVSTPASGWFRCSGERGCGVALLLGLADWVARLDANCNWLFCATSGHELGHAGMLHLMESAVLPNPNIVACWIVLGASVAARHWDKSETGWKQANKLADGLNLVSTPKLAEVVKPAFASVLELKTTVAPVGGEQSHVIRKGYATFGIFGGHFWFHTKLDSPETTDGGLLELVSRPIAVSIRQLLKRDL